MSKVGRGSLGPRGDFELALQEACQSSLPFHRLVTLKSKQELHGSVLFRLELAHKTRES